MPVEININGGLGSVEVDPSTPLLYVLRNDQGPTAAAIANAVADAAQIRLRELPLTADRVSAALRALA